MALNIDQLIWNWVCRKFSLPKKCCLSEKAEITRLRFSKARKIKEELEQWPYEVRRQMVQEWIDKEMQNV